MRISSFLTFITFCFLLFMEYTLTESAYINLDADLDRLISKLTDLRSDLTNAKVGELIDKVKSAKANLGDRPKNPQGRKEVREDINISKPVEEVRGSISEFSKELDGLLNEIKNTWEGQIQMEVNKAISSLPR